MPFVLWIDALQCARQGIFSGVPDEYIVMANYVFSRNLRTLATKQGWSWVCTPHAFPLLPSCWSKMIVTVSSCKYTRQNIQEWPFHSMWKLFGRTTLGFNMPLISSVIH